MNPETDKEFSKEELAILNDQEVPDAAPAVEADESVDSQPAESESADRTADSHDKVADKPVERPRTEDGKFAPKTEIEAPRQEPKPKERKSVPLAEHLSEREKRQAAEKEAQELREARARLEGAYQQLSQRFAQPQEPPKPQPTVEEQPLEVLKATQQRLAEFERQQQEAQITAQFSQHVSGLARQFKAQNPDYDQALKFVADMRRQELALFGMPPQMIDQQLVRDEFEVSAAALQNGRNPAEVIYGMARARGFQPANGTQAHQAAPNGQAASQTGPSLETIAKGQQASRSLGNVGGAAPDTLTGIDRIASMSEKEIANLSPEEFRKIMEG